MVYSLVATNMDEFKLRIPTNVSEALVSTQGVYYEELSGIDRYKIANDVLSQDNVGWVKRQIRLLQREGSVEVLGLGDDVFLERMTSLDFATWATLGRIKHVLELIGNRHVRRLLARIIIALRGWTLIVLTLRKRP